MKSSVFVLFAISCVALVSISESTGNEEFSGSEFDRAVAPPMGRRGPRTRMLLPLSPDVHSQRKVKRSNDNGDGASRHTRGAMSHLARGSKKKGGGYGGGGYGGGGYGGKKGKKWG